MNDDEKQYAAEWNDRGESERTWNRMRAWSRDVGERPTSWTGTIVFVLICIFAVIITYFTFGR